MAAISLLAIFLPLLSATATVPDSVFYNQVLAATGWGLWLLSMPWTAMGTDSQAKSARPTLLAATAALALCPVFALLRLDHGQGAPALVLCASVAVLWASSGKLGRHGVPAMAWAWLLAGLACVLVAMVQYFAPSMADGWFVAPAGAAGRSVGNMRQPNHLATALLCAIVMTTWLWHAGRLRAPWAAVSLFAMVLAVALSASRTGALSLGVLLLWAVVDRTLPRAARWTLALAPVAYLLCWAGLAEYAAWQHAHFYAAERLQANGDISSSRFAIWRNALTLIAQNPWAGVGWGNFNFAWTFTPFPDRPVAFFDHTHNLPLQLAVEIGLPATALVLGLFGWALWRARGAWRVAGEQPGHPARAVFVMLAVLGVHSLLEYPLWYAYFLLPAAWALGVFLGSAPTKEPASNLHAPASPVAATVARWSTFPLRAAGALMIIGAAYAAWDHRRVEVIFAPPAGAGSLAERIAAGRESVLFGHHADYAAVTNEPKDQALASFRRPLHHLVDARLLVAYIEALKANGHDAEALYAAQRLREFRRDDAQAYFKECTADNPAPPFQCRTEPVALTWRDLEP
ncbi:PglL family O-oligosaccharyltransferase [Methylibium sp. Root1272]|uniref:PglL family O-oligosaccharyltransferase n=1 Tax=Methylibium sp. Root1272 TaxID=1736441 RepID=UPI000A3FA35E|nr:O-antigen ligase family protein [Methylibium sp. Root1272]